MSTHDWHALVALGTDGGQPLAGGGRLDRGVHLLWSMRPELGFPLGGYQVWRREHHEAEWVCFDIVDAAPPAGGATSWTWLGFELEASRGPLWVGAPGCGTQPALHLAATPDVGDRTLAVNAPREFAAVRAAGAGEPPLVEVFAAAGDETTVVERRQAAATATGWHVEFWSERIAGVRFSGPEISLCSLCFGIGDTIGRWDRLHEDPILLPVVPPGTANLAVHIQVASRTQAEARTRLPATLPAATRDALSAAFAGEPRELVEMFLRGGRESMLPAQPDAPTGSRTPPALGLPAGTLLALLALDPAVSRMLGLYWHDPVDRGRWDYKVVARHGDARWPGRRVTFGGMEAGPLPEPKLVRQGLTFVGSGGLEILSSGGPNAGPALRVHAPAAGTVAGVQLRSSKPAVTIARSAAPFSPPFFATLTGWRGQIPVATAGFVANLATVEHPAGLDAVTWSVALDVAEVVLHDEPGTVGNLAAFAWNQSPRPPAPVRALVLDACAGASEPTRMRADGRVDPQTGVAGLDWSDPLSIDDVARPVRVQVARSNRGNGDAPLTSAAFVVRNQASPAVAFARPRGRRGDWPGPDVPHRWTERGLAPGWYAWRVRGIDAFGRLAAWSAERTCEVRSSSLPPPPDAVTARYLEKADPFLAPADRALVETDGDGLLVEWTWTAERRMRAPAVESGGEFRVYVRRGDPNDLSGTVTAVTDLGDRSRLATDLDWPGDGNALVGERLRVGGASFEVVGHGSGRNSWIEVVHLTAPTRRPTPGAFTITLSEQGRAHTTLAQARAFDRRVHVEPAGEIARITTRVTGASGDNDAATITLAEALPPSSHELAGGLLASGGTAWPVMPLTPGSTQVVVRAVPQADGSMRLPAPGDPCTLWSGARYRAWLPGLHLRPDAGTAPALTLVAVSSADGDLRAGDDDAWNDEDRGGLGGRPGREGPLSRPVRVRVPHRVPPPPVRPSLPPEVDGDVPADLAEPADWYGRARYTLTFPAVPGATGYRVLRAGTASLFARDRTLRQTGAAPYAAGPFDDAGASEAWLAAHYPHLSPSDLVGDPAALPPDVQAAWREWTGWFYPRLLNKDVMRLAEIAGNQDAFAPAHAGTIDAPPFRDTLDGRGLGRFVYRVRSVDASGNIGAWSGAFPLVDVRDITPPATPRVIATAGYDRAAWICWQPNSEPDLAAYRIWRSDDPAELERVHRMAPIAEIAAAEGSPVTWSDAELQGLRTYHYRLAAVDASGNVSAPTPTLSVRVTDSQPPKAPTWERSEWVLVNGSGREYPIGDPRAGSRFTPAVVLQWLAGEAVESAIVERRSDGERLWRPIATLTVPVDRLAPPETEAARRYTYHDRAASPDVANEYRIRLRKHSGAMNIAEVAALVVEAVQL